MSYDWGPEEYAALAPEVRQVRDILEDWFRALESGWVQQKSPDPLYCPSISTEVVDSIIQLLDEEFDKELSWASTEKAGQYSRGPDFARLTPEQRLALVQQLHHALKRSK